MKKFFSNIGEYCLLVVLFSLMVALIVGWFALLLVYPIFAIILLIIFIATTS